MKYLYLSLSLIVTSIQFTLAQSDCSNAICVPGSTFAVGTVSGPGSPDPVSSCSCIATNEDDSFWFTFEAITSGTFTMTITPLGLGADYDFALFAGACPCGGGSQTIACSYVGPITPPGPFVPTGIGAGGAEFVPTVNLVAGETYYILANNITDNDVGFSIEFGGSAVISCDPACFAEAGTINTQPIESCLGDPSLNLNLPPSGGATTSGDFTYGYVVVQGGIIQQIIASPDLTVFPPGNYEICGFAYLTDDAALTPIIIGQPYATVQADFASGNALFCGDLTDNCKPVTIGDLVPPTIVTEEACPGDCITFAGQQICGSGGDVTLQSYLGCDSIITVIINPILVVPTVITETVCPSECLTVAGQSVCPPGTTLTIPSYQGCDSLITVILTEATLLPLIIPDGAPIIDCANGGVLLDGSSSIPMGNYSWSGPSGPLGNSPTIFADEPGTYSLTITDTSVSPPCEDETSIDVIGGLGEPNLVVADAPIFCAGTTVDLTAINVIDVNGVATSFTYHTGTPATPANQVSNTTVTLNLTTVFYVFADVNGCSSEAPIVITIQPDIFPVIIPLGPPFLGCNGEPVILDGTSSAGPPNYQWTAPDGAMGNGPTFNATIAGEYTLTIVDNTVTPPCEASTTLTIFPNIGAPNLLVADAPIFCEGDTIDLEQINIIDINGTTTNWTFHTATPPTVSNQLTELVFPATVSNLYYVFAENNGCGSEAPLVITVLPDPLADFTATSPICTNESSTVTYTGVSADDAVYTWDFAGGTAIPGTGQGPHQVTWPSAGSYTIQCTVEEGGCTSDVFEQTVIVGAPAQAPIIQCGDIGTNSVEFIWNTVSGASGYTVNVLTGQVGTQADTTFTVNNLSAGEVVTIEVTADGTGTCGTATATHTCTALSCGNVVLTIQTVDDICLDNNSTAFDLMVDISGDNGTGTGTWSGMGITDANLGTFDPTIAGIGSHDLTFSYTENGCDFSDMLTINIFARPTAEFIASGPICNDETSTIQFNGMANATATFTWGFDGGTATPGTGIGPHTVEWSSGGEKIITLIVEENGCISEQFSAQVLVDEPLASPVINCNTNTNSIEFIWNTVPGATNYIPTVISGATGMLTSDTSYLVTGLNPNDMVTLEVEVVGDGACGSITTSATCEAQDCPNIMVTIDDVDDICLVNNLPNIILNASQDGGLGGGTFTWDGDGIVDQSTGTFDPNTGTIGGNNIVATYQEGNCTFNASTIINIFDIPTAEFTVNSPNCIDEDIIVNYSGNASSNATFTWDFAGASASSTAGPGPHTISWPLAGEYVLQLMVEENGCSSIMGMQTVTIEAPIPSPQIMCNTTTNSIEFIWSQIDGATGYNITVLDGATGSLTSDTSYLVANLNAGDAITIEVEALTDNVCGNSVAEQTCIASDCPDVMVSIDMVDNICLDGNHSAIDLTATITGNTISGMLTWDGDGVVNDTFDPNAAMVGANQISLVYEENNCAYSASASINVFAQPTSEFSIDGLICVDDIGNISYEGSASANADYQWDFAGGTVVSGTGEGPYEISWSAAGDYTISLVATEIGCVSEPFTQIINVDPLLVAPVISCITNTSQIELVWNQVQNADSYAVNVLAGETGILTTDTSYLVTGLVPGDEVAIQLTVASDNACEDLILTQLCIAQDCPPIDLSIQDPGLICSEDSPFDLSVTVNGGNGTGSGIWQGTGITNILTGTFDPTNALLGNNAITYNFEETGCQFSDTINVEVQPALVAPTFSCNTTTETIELIIDTVLNATDYEVNVLTGQTGSFTNPTVYFIDDLLPNTQVDFEITVSGNTICGPVTTLGSCTAQDCPNDVMVTIEEVPDICDNTANPEITLSVDVTNGTGSGLWEGIGITNQLAGIFDVSVAGVGNHIITYTYTQGDCIYNDNITINILPTPTAEFTVEAVICQTDFASVNFEGTTTGNANYSWNFDGGLANPGGNSPGPHTVTWTTGGTKNISLIINDDGCESNIFSQTVEVELPLISPVVNCNTTTESVEFVWESVDGATSYDVTVLSGQTGNNTSDTSILFTNLDPNESVVVEIEAISGGLCENIIIPITCQAIDCPPITLALTEVPPICFLPTTNDLVELEATVSGATNGIGLWSGDGVTSTIDGIFDPNAVGAGIYQVVYTFTEANCSYNSAINIEIVDVPTADAGQTATLTCEMNGSSTQLGGIGSSIGNDIVYDWDWSGGAFPGDSTIANPVISLPGTYTINVINTTLGCFAQASVLINASQEIPNPEISVSDISCFGESDGILEVISVAGGQAPYTYSLNEGPFTDNPEFTNLSPGNYVVSVMDANGCEGSGQIIITEPNELEVQLISLFDGENIIIVGDTVNLQAIVNVPIDNLDVVLWSPPQFLSCDTCINVSAFPVQTTTFSVLIESGACEASDDLTIEVDRPDFPNAISPNGDGKNETFVIPGLDNFENPRMTIVNRWGSVVWDSQPYQNEWGGTNQDGEPLPGGTYYYVLRYDLAEGDILVGHVTIIY